MSHWERQTESKRRDRRSHKGRGKRSHLARQRESQRRSHCGRDRRNRKEEIEGAATGSRDRRSHWERQKGSRGEAEGVVIRKKRQKELQRRDRHLRRKWPFMLNWDCGGYITSVQWVQDGSKANQSSGITPVPWSDSTQNSSVNGYSAAPGQPYIAPTGGGGSLACHELSQYLFPPKDDATCAGHGPYRRRIEH
jgi:hypothetical protein